MMHLRRRVAEAAEEWQQQQQGNVNGLLQLLEACIDTSCDSGTSTLETYYSNFVARQ